MRVCVFFKFLGDVGVVGVGGFFRVDGVEISGGERIVCVL